MLIVWICFNCYFVIFELFGFFHVSQGPHPVGARRVGARRVGARRVGARTQKKWGPEGWGLEGWGPEGWEPEGPKISRFFSLSRHEIHSFLPSLGVFSWNFGGVLKRRDPQMCTFGVLGLSCASPGGPRRRGQCHSTLHRFRSTAQLSVRTLFCSLHITSHSHCLKFETCQQSWSSTCHPCVRPLHPELHFLLLSLPPVCLPLHFLPPQRQTAAGVLQEGHGKPVRLRQQRE